jgi:hypothetical protein
VDSTGGRKAVEDVVGISIASVAETTTVVVANVGGEPVAPMVGSAGGHPGVGSKVADGTGDMTSVGEVGSGREGVERVLVSDAVGVGPFHGGHGPRVGTGTAVGVVPVPKLPSQRILSSNTKSRV